MTNTDRTQKLDLKTGDWTVRIKVYQCLAKNPNNLSAVLRELGLHVGEQGYPPHLPDKATIKKMRQELSSFSPVLVSDMPLEVQFYAQNLNPQLKEELLRLKADNKSATTVQQEPYIETPHKRKIRQLAAKLANQIRFPSTWNHSQSGIGTWGDLPVDFRPGSYSLPEIGELKIDENRQVLVSNPDLTLGIAEPYLIGDLLSHIRTSQKPKFIELVGDDGQLSKLSSRIGEYSQSLMSFLKIIADETIEFGTQVNYKDEARPGLSRWFILTIWNDAIQQAARYPWIDDSWYKPPKIIAGTGLWQQVCGSFEIGLADSINELTTYENWHKELRAKYGAHSLAKDISAKSQGMSEMAEEIKQRLHEFADMEHLLGRCDLCPLVER